MSAPESNDSRQPCRPARGDDRDCMSQTRSLSALIWSGADLMRGDYRPSEYGRDILPFTALRRLPAVHRGKLH